MKKKLMSMVMAVSCMLSMVSAQAKGSLAWNESSGKVSVTADKAGTYDVAFTNNKGNTALKEVIFNEAGTQELSVPTDFAASKVFMWDSIEQMKPLAEAMDITECYGTAVVYSIVSEKVYFEAYTQDLTSRWEINANADIKIIKDGQEIEYTELRENDVLTIDYDVDAGFESSEYYNVYVSTDTVSGTVTAIETDPEINTVRVNGTDYRCNLSMIGYTEDMFELRTNYILYLDIFGNVAYMTEATVQKNYGIIVGMYTMAGNDYATVRMITRDGEIVEYECKDASEEDTFRAIVDPDGELGDTVSKWEICESVGLENAVVIYNISNDRIWLKDTLSPKGNDVLEYKASSSKLGSYAISDGVTSIVGLDEYLNGAGEPISLTSSNLVDKDIYSAYLYDKNNDGTYRFAIVLAGELVNLPEEPEEPETIGLGVVVGMYTTAGSDYATVRMITQDGEVVAYECKDASEEDTFRAIVDPDYELGDTVTKWEICESVGIENAVVKYSLSGDKLRLVEAMSPNGGDALEYKVSSSKLELYAISDATSFLGLDEYLNGAGEPVGFTSANLVNEGIYSAYLYDKNNDGTYRFAIVLAGELVNLPEEPEEPETIGLGVVVGMYTTAGSDYATVRMITQDGEIVAYECKDFSEEAAFRAIVDPDGELGDTVSKWEICESVGIENAVVKYSLSGNKLRLVETMTATGGNALEFKADESKLGAYSINDSVSKIIDMDAYLNRNSTEVGTMTLASFEDEAIYEAYLFDMDENNTYRFAIVLSGTTAIRATASFGVIKRNPGVTDLDGTECLETIVVRDGVEDTVLCIEDTNATPVLSEGDVVVYKEGSYGYVEADKIIKIFSADRDYDSFFADTIYCGNFSDMIEYGIIDSDNRVTYGIDAYTTEKEIELYFGAIYSKTSTNLSLIKGMDDDKLSNVEDEEYLVDIEINSDTNTYVYDYGKPTRNRVYIGQIPYVPNSFWNIARAGEMELIDWDAVETEELTPHFALVRVVDGVAKDVVVFQAE